MSHIVILHHAPIQLHLLELLLKQDHEIVSCYTDWDDLKDVLRDGSDVDGMVLDLHTMSSPSVENGSLLESFFNHWFYPIPVLGLTQSSCESEMIQLPDMLSMQAFLSFPLDPQDFRLCVQQLIHQRSEYEVLHV